MHISALLAVLPLLALTSASPTPLQKRYTYAKIRSGRDGLCLSAGPKTGIGSPVLTTNCADAFVWTINPGSGSILLDDTYNPQLALDAGENPGNNGALKVWESYPGLYQQTWYLTDDNRIAITGGDQCLDEGDNGVQTYQCTTGNTNQVWYIDTDGEPQPSTTASSTPTPSSTTPPASDPLPDLPQSAYIHADPTVAEGGGTRLRIKGRNDLCVTIQGGFTGPGTQVAISGCFNDDDYFLREQLWDLPQGTTGQIKVHANPDYCLDAGENVANGNPITVYNCLDVPQQQWTWTGDGLLQVNNNQCLDVKRESTSSYNKPYIFLKELQTWECSAQDLLQNFAVYNGPEVAPK